MKRILMSSLLLVVLSISFVPVCYAQNIESFPTPALVVSKENEPGISPMWVYQFLYSEQRYGMMAVEHASQIYVTGVPSGHFKPDGTEYLAQGYLNLDSVAYDFPWKGYKTIWYTGLVTAYIG